MKNQVNVLTNIKDMEDMNRLQYVKTYFNKFISEDNFRSSIKLMSLDFTEAQIIEGYDYILTLKVSDH